jgi:environmental stress-induced protein Ves
MNAARIRVLAPSAYRRTPWKNGRGVAIDIAGASRPGCQPGEWNGMLWRFGRTTIEADGPFSDLAGFDRLQMVVMGGGLVLQAPTREIDVREPFVPVRFEGETAIFARLEAGPVDVVNLIADRSFAAIDLLRLAAGAGRQLAPGLHVCYAPNEACALRCDGKHYELAAGHALQVHCDEAVLVEALGGILLVGSVFPIEEALR